MSVYSLQLLNIGSYYNYPGFESTGEFLCVVSKEYPNNVNTDDIPPTDRAMVRTKIVQGWNGN